VFAGEGRASVRALAATADGGAITAGGFDGELTAGETRLAAVGGDDGFAAALSPAGEVRWAVGLGGTAGDELAAAAVSARGEVAVAGFADGAAVLAGTQVAADGHPAALVARLDPVTGRPAWVRGIGSSGYAVATSLAWAGADLVVAGYFGGTLDPDGARLNGAGALDLFVARLAGADGRVLWIHRGGGPGTDSAQAIAVADDGAILVAGSFTRWADLSSTHLAALDEDGDPFVARVGEVGFEWARSFTSEGAAVARGVVPLRGGRIALAVEFDGHLAAGFERTESAGATDVCVIALEPAGTVSWIRRIGGPAVDSAAGLWRDGDRLLLVGSFADALGSLRSEGGRDGYAVALGARGAPVWQERLGSAGDELIAAGAAAGGRLLAGGSVTDHYDIGGTAGDAAGESDGFATSIMLPR
jgi:outer membrane protein assembly factor BamB